MIVRIMYVDEIVMMMHYSGNNSVTTSSTAIYLESVVRNYIHTVLSLSERIRKLRQGKYIEIEDVCFVFRNDPVKINKIIETLKHRDVKLNLENRIKEYDVSFDWHLSSKKYKDIDRLEALDSITKDMSKDEYIKYTKCREASFTHKQHTKFKRFIRKNSIKSDVIDVLGVLGTELIFDIVQKAIQVRKEKYKKRKEMVMFRLQRDSKSLTINELYEGTRRVFLKNIITSNRIL